MSIEADNKIICVFVVWVKPPEADNKIICGVGQTTWNR